MSLAEGIKKLFGSKIKEILEPKTLPLEVKEDTGVQEIDIRNKDILNFENLYKSNVQLQNVNLGIENHYHVYLNNPTEAKPNGEEATESEIAKKVKEIEKLQEESKFLSAIKAYNSLMEDSLGKTIDVNDKFSLLNGLFSCYVNLNDTENIEKYMKKISDLGAVSEIYRHHFLCAIYFLNKRELKRSLVEITKAVTLKVDYFKGLCMKVFIESDLKVIDYKTAINVLIDEEGKPKLGTGNNRDNSYVFNILGYVNLIFKNNDKAIEFFTKANELSPSKAFEGQIGIARFNKAIEKNTDGYIRQQEVDFDELNKAISIFDTLYNIEDDEIRQGIRKQISPFYFRCLFLANNFSKFNNVFSDMKEYCQSEKSELYRIKALTEVMEGTISEETKKELPPEEQQYIHFVDLMNNEKYEKVIEELSPIVWGCGKDEERYHGMILQSYICIDDLKGFVKHFKAIKDKGLQSQIVDLMEALYLEKTGDLEKAERIITDIANNNSDYLIYFELISFYQRNNLNDQLEVLYDDLFQNKKAIIEPRKSKFYYRYFLYLFTHKKIVRAMEVFNTLTPDDLSEIDYLKVSAEINTLTGNYKKSAVEHELLYEKTNDLEDLFSSLLAYLHCNNIVKSEEIIKLLIRKDFKRKFAVYGTYSNVEILKGNAEKAFEYAKIVKEIDKDKPNSEAHPFFVQKGMRCGKEEGTSYVYEYAYHYPQHQQWLKGYKGLETDENGNEVISKEFMDVLEALRNQFSDNINSYRTRFIGITTLAKVYGNTIPEILDWRDIYNIKASISSGDINETMRETSNFDSKIVIDTFGLYILAEIGYLNLLNHFDKVYVTYSSIESLQQTLLKVEKAKVREIFEFIDNAINIEVVCPNFKLCSELNDDFDKLFEKFQVDSAVYSYTTDTPYIYCDHHFKKYINVYNSKFLGIVAFIRALNINGKIDNVTLSDLVLNLKQHKYDFINFNSTDIYNTVVKSGFTINNDIKLFFTLEKDIDFISFIRVYVEFFRMVYGKIPKDKFDEFFDLYVNIFDKYLKKSQYYFNVLEMTYGKEFTQIMDTLETDSIWSAIYYIQLMKDELTNSPELNRAVYIIVCCHGALRFLLQMFRDDSEDFEYYSNRARSLVVNITQTDINNIIRDATESNIEQIQQERPA